MLSEPPSTTHGSFPVISFQCNLKQSMLLQKWVKGHYESKRDNDISLYSVVINQVSLGAKRCADLSSFFYVTYDSVTITSSSVRLNVF